MNYAYPTSATLAWDNEWENMILLDLQPPADTFFEGADPMIGTEGLGESWMNMQEWADLSLLLEVMDSATLQDIETETETAGGIRFCCYGMVSTPPSSICQRKITKAIE